VYTVQQLRKRATTNQSYSEQSQQLTVKDNVNSKSTKLYHDKH